MQCNVFAWCRKLVGNFPVCGLLCVTALFAKHRTVSVMPGLDDKVNDVPLKNMIGDIAARIL